MIEQVIKKSLKPLTVDIDHGKYTTEVLSELGKVGAFSPHIPSQNNGNLDLFKTIQNMAQVSEECMSTGFMMWAHTVCEWYIENSENEWLKSEILPKMVEGELFGATSLSNPMKYFAGIEPLKVYAVETEDGYLLNGALPWVSNIWPNSDKHFFGCIFHVQDEAGNTLRDAMALIPCDLENLTLQQQVEFIGMEGTGTFAMVFDDAFLPKKYLLADPVGPYLQKIKAGFVLLQAGMAVGVIQGCINEMNKSNLSLSAINQYLDNTPEELQEELNDAAEIVQELCEKPYTPGDDFFKSVLEVRLLGAEICKRAADSVMQHAGAKGYIVDAPAQRKMREAYFVIIVTPSIKHLRKEIQRLEVGLDAA
ncbi:MULTISPECIES: acyl-CoA dehydrogenase family protein [Thiomicrorhabdus]|uniref:Acyl-CoA/acyl-ACP dehydrogenase n=1 Tax=Thiomicrorhabdus heinhorstiae TaxID=2748010 RepID=A0ABS0BZG7_9GAMM|nr:MULTISPECIES: acyl-CoA dehydrogenase family protein [Thiomicrorhabdus]MBF6058478.1 acyl-CoA/acyl-ACP dehydrogenase [Thiomicrorhabdus heinhorstiae]